MCQIEITGTSGADFDQDAGGFQSLRVHGRISGCTPETDDEGNPILRLLVQAQDDGGHANSAQLILAAPPDAEAFVHFAAYLKGVRCGHQIHVHVECGPSTDMCADDFDLFADCSAVACPPVTFEVVASDCDADGQRVVTITATVEGEPLLVTAVWRYGANGGRVTTSDFIVSNSSTVELVFTEADLADGDVQLTLNPLCIYSHTLSPGELLPCDQPCPEMTLGGQVDRGCDDSGNRVIGVTIEFDPDYTGNARVEYGSGRQNTVYVDGGSVEVELLYAPNDLDQPSIVIVTLNEQLEEVCRSPELALAGTLAPCPPPESPPEETQPPDETPTEEIPPDETPPVVIPPPEDGGGFDLCVAWLIANIILLIGAGIATIVAFCVPNPISISIAIGLAVLATVSSLVWLFVCGTAHCELLRWFVFVLTLLNVLSLITTGVFLLIGIGDPAAFACAVGAAITWGYYGTFAAFASLVGIQGGCYDNESVFPWEESRE